MKNTNLITGPGYADAIARSDHYKGLGEWAAATHDHETVTVADIKEGDVVIKLGNVTFPFPFHISKATEIRHGGKSHGTMLHASHGWFSGRPVKNDDIVVRVVIGS